MTLLKPPSGFRVGPWYFSTCHTDSRPRQTPSKTVAADLSGRKRLVAEVPGVACSYGEKGKDEHPQEPRPSLKSMMSDVWEILRIEKEYYEECN